jgi:hypothetical protein
MSMLPPSLRNGSDAMPAFTNRLDQCLSVRITLVRNTDSFRLS